MPGPEAFAEAAKSGIERQIGDLDAQYEARLIELAQEQAAAELTALRAKLAAAEAENARLREVAEDAEKALPVLRAMLKSAGLSAGVIVAEGMISRTSAALQEPTDGR